MADGGAVGGDPVLSLLPVDDDLSPLAVAMFVLDQLEDDGGFLSPEEIAGIRLMLLRNDPATVAVFAVYSSASKRLLSRGGDGHEEGEAKAVARLVRNLRTLVYDRDLISVACGTGGVSAGESVPRGLYCDGDHGLRAPSECSGFSGPLPSTYGALPSSTAASPEPAGQDVTLIDVPHYAERVSTAGPVLQRSSRPATSYDTRGREPSPMNWPSVSTPPHDRTVYIHRSRLDRIDYVDEKLREMSLDGVSADDVVTKLQEFASENGQIHSHGSGSSSCYWEVPDLGFKLVLYGNPNCNPEDTTDILELHVDDLLDEAGLRKVLEACCPRYYDPTEALSHIAFLNQSAAGAHVKESVISPAEAGDEVTIRLVIRGYESTSSSTETTK